MNKRNICTLAVIACSITMILTSCEKEDDHISYDEGKKKDDHISYDEDENGDKLNYYLFSDTKEAVINNGNVWSGELDIPSEIKINGMAYSVTGIAWRAFYKSNELTKVRIPKTLVNVIHHVLSGDPEINGAVSQECMNPFESCKVLRSIEVDTNNPSMKSVDGVIFSKDGTGLYCYPAGINYENYVVPDGVTWIGAGAFEGNEYIVSVELPSTVEKLCGNAFWNCTKLESVILSEKLTVIGGAVFRGCSNLKSITIPSGIKRINDYTFSGCSSLTELYLPLGITQIGHLAFNECKFKRLVIRGIIDERDLDKYIFGGMDISTIIYTQTSEVDKFKKIYDGVVLPLDSLNSSGTRSAVRFNLPDSGDQ